MFEWKKWEGGRSKTTQQQNPKNLAWVFEQYYAIFNKRLLEKKLIL